MPQGEGTYGSKKGRPPKKKPDAKRASSYHVETKIKDAAAARERAWKSRKVYEEAMRALTQDGKKPLGPTEEAAMRAARSQGQDQWGRERWVEYAFAVNKQRSRRGWGRTPPPSEYDKWYGREVDNSYREAEYLHRLKKTDKRFQEGARAGDLVGSEERHPLVGSEERRPLGDPVFAVRGNDEPRAMAGSEYMRADDMARYYRGVERDPLWDNPQADADADADAMAEYMRGVEAKANAYAEAMADKRAKKSRDEAEGNFWP